MPRSNRNRQVVPESRHMLNQMKYEIAAEFGLNVGYGSSNGADTEFGSELGAIGGSSSNRRPGWGHLTSRENGSVGGEITKRLVRNAEQSLFGRL
ncbi:MULTISPECIES: alpha/beta-type small acid-soluble spore protein [Paenibacillus]|uniref:alpha/beta-type small acid-soluble spore protein n=1 Tax=Paenibacillus TaxID=44249 RepID=UPI001B04C5DC|nr:alpha/beta-type small acid-soluble spore protein [Paenibacillus lactis]MCM3493492.1 alpha/beta-type small acid-soluble spore protein [Paenibacillus lactis]GIO92599.1 small, acid-soluble spore protein 1 [Paenibacillus lactis]